jgi:hypothetical protein
VEHGRRGVAAEQAGVGDVLDVLRRGTQGGGVVPGLADGGGDRGASALADAVWPISPSTTA